MLAESCESNLNQVQLPLSSNYSSPTNANTNHEMKNNKENQCKLITQGQALQVGSEDQSYESQKLTRGSKKLNGGLGKIQQVTVTLPASKSTNVSRSTASLPKQ